LQWNYGSDEANLNAVYEAMRTHPPVASVSSIAQQPVEIDIAGEVHRFPPGTKIMYNMKTASKDPSIHVDALK
jgi:cytochrome P450